MKADWPQKLTVLGCLVSRRILSGAVLALEELLASGTKHQVVCLTVDSIIAARKDPRLRSLYNGASLALPDGIPVVWASRILGEPVPGRAAGPDLLLAASAAAARRGYTFYLMGGGSGIAERLAEALARQVSRAPSRRRLLPSIPRGVPGRSQRRHRRENQRGRSRTSSGSDWALPSRTGGSRRTSSGCPCGWPSGSAPLSTCTAERPAERPCGCRGAGWSGFSGSCASPGGCSAGISSKAPPFLPLVLLQRLRQRTPS